MQLGLKSVIVKSAQKDFGTESIISKAVYSDFGFRSSFTTPYNDMSIASSVAKTLFDGYTLVGKVNFNTKQKDFSIFSSTVIDGSSDMSLREIRIENINKTISLECSVVKSNWKSNFLMCGYIVNKMKDMSLFAIVRKTNRDNLSSHSLMSSVYKEDIREVTDYLSIIGLNETLISGVVPISGFVSPSSILQDLAIGKFDNFVGSTIAENIIKIHVEMPSSVNDVYSFLMRRKTAETVPVSSFRTEFLIGRKVFGEVFDVFSDLVTIRTVSDTRTYVIDDGDQFLFDFRMSRRRNFLKTNFISPLKRKPFLISNSFFNSITEAGWTNGEEVYFSPKDDENLYIESRVLTTISVSIRSISVGYSYMHMSSSLIEYKMSGHAYDNFVLIHKDSSEYLLNQSIYDKIIAIGQDGADIHSPLFSKPMHTSRILSGKGIKQKKDFLTIEMRKDRVRECSIVSSFFVTAGYKRLSRVSDSMKLELINGNVNAIYSVPEDGTVSINDSVIGHYEQIVIANTGMDNTVSGYMEVFAILNNDELLETNIENIQINKYNEEFIIVKVKIDFTDTIEGSMEEFMIGSIDSSNILSYYSDIYASVRNTSVVGYSEQIIKLRVIV